MWTKPSGCPSKRFLESEIQKREESVPAATSDAYWWQWHIYVDFLSPSLHCGKSGRNHAETPEEGESGLYIDSRQTHDRRWGFLNTLICSRWPFCEWKATEGEAEEERVESSASTSGQGLWCGGLLLIIPYFSCLFVPRGEPLQSVLDKSARWLVH